MLKFAAKRGYLIENSKKVAIKFGRMKGNVYFCRQKVIKRNETWQKWQTIGGGAAQDSEDREKIAAYL